MTAMLKDLLPPKARQGLYLVFVAAFVAAIVLEDGFTVETVLKAGGALGFGLAAGNVDADDA